MEPVRDKPTQAREMFGDANPAVPDGKDRENDQWNGHRPGSLLRVLGFLCAGFAEEGQCDLAHRIEGSQERSNCESPENPEMAMTERIREDLILRPEASRNQRETRKREPADQECPESDRNLPAQASHVEHILRVHMVIASV